MTISVLTFSKEMNFGANLQCYALCKVLQEMGHQINILDIQLSKPRQSWYSMIMNLPMRWFFWRFRKRYLNLFTKHFSNVDVLRKNYPHCDLYIVGSDQVWNPQITKRLNPLVYFFSFLPEGAHRISYAASFGTKTWDSPELTMDVYKLLHQFDAVSIREEAGIKICKETFNIEAKLVLDPTLLLSSYDDICGAYDVRKENNDLAYFTFINDSVVRNVIADFAESHHLQAMHLRSNHSYPRFKRRLYLSVDEWLNAIRYSKIVVTNSFHCMVFCLIFHKRFVVIPGKVARTSRQEGLLSLLGLLDYYCGDTNELHRKLEFALSNEIDYKKVDEKLVKLRDESLDFLTKYC